MMRYFADHLGIKEELTMEIQAMCFDLNEIIIVSRANELLMLLTHFY